MVISGGGDDVVGGAVLGGGIVVGGGGGGSVGKSIVKEQLTLQAHHILPVAMYGPQIQTWPQLQLSHNNYVNPR